MTGLKNSPLFPDVEKQGGSFSKGWGGVFPSDRTDVDLNLEFSSKLPICLTLLDLLDFSFAQVGFLSLKIIDLNEIIN